jgi:hypothetical protein
MTTGHRTAESPSTGRARRNTPTRISVAVLAVLAATAVVLKTNLAAGDENVGPVRATAAEESLLVLVRGVGLCSGAPVLGTNLVVTAAHCLIDPVTGGVSNRLDLRVERGNVRYDIEAVLIDPVTTTPGERGIRPDRDGAILVMREPVPGPGVSLDDRPNGPVGSVAIVGYQPLGENGTFSRPDNYLARDSATNALMARAAATCHAPWEDVVIRKGALIVPCGMIPGGSGGPVIGYGPGGETLLGVLSSVDLDLAHNGVTPVSELRRLLADRERYTIELDRPNPDGETRLR